MQNQATSIGASDETNCVADPPIGPVNITDPMLTCLVDVAVPLILTIAVQGASGVGTPVHIAEVLYLHACLAASSVFPVHIQQNPCTAF